MCDRDESVCGCDQDGRIAIDFGLGWIAGVSNSFYIYETEQYKFFARYTKNSIPYFKLIYSVSKVAPLRLSGVRVEHIIIK